VLRQAGYWHLRLPDAVGKSSHHADRSPILADLRKKAESIGLEDVLIAASALANQYIVVTANIRHFTRIKGLKVEKWLEAV
jgi:predicted nucleic acid-binding protein